MTQSHRGMSGIIATLRAQLAGEVIEAVERDAPPVGAGRFAPGE